MKQILFTSFFVPLLTIVINCTAQQELAYSKTSSRKGGTSYMRLIAENVADPTYYSRGESEKITNITTRAIRHFLVNFNEVSNETWYSTPDLFVAMFKLNDIDYRVDYDRNGNWIETYRTYDQTKMSPELKQAVESAYWDYHVYLVQEIEQALHPILYVVHLENKRKLINLQVSDGVVYEWQNFNKSK
ncbi:MAG TPA: hypothetical protein VFP87_12015 [Chitinophagaceae bacterium]|nr:hypothetical protein [Chitinophagaceae bacterium]